MSSKLVRVVDHIQDLRRYALALTRNGQDAEDLVQEALARAYDRRSSFRLGRSLKPWLMAILHNTFVDGVRAQKTRMTHEAGTAPQLDFVAPAQDEAVHLSEVRRAFLELPEEQREALHLVGIEGLTYPEAAQVLGVPEGTILSRVSRARKALREREHAPKPSHLKIVGGSHGS
jgi:RNA polymerase sigma-70 factor (ECF subfamily)